LVFVLEPFNINRGIERSIFIVIGEKRQLLILPLLTLGGAIGVWAIKKLRLCFSNVWYKRPEYLFQMTMFMMITEIVW